MKGIQIQFYILVLMSLTWQLVVCGTSQENVTQNKINSLENDVSSAESSELIGRFRRQTSTTTTARPKKNRPGNLFGLISVLISETRDDTNRAINEIGTLFNSQFTENNATTPKSEQTTTTTTASSDSSDNEDEDNEITTTTEPFRISRDEFFGILRSNVQGLVQLFGKEFRIAIKDRCWDNHYTSALLEKHENNRAVSRSAHMTSLQLECRQSSSSHPVPLPWLKREDARNDQFINYEFESYNTSEADYQEHTSEESNLGTRNENHNKP